MAPIRSLLHIVLMGDLKPTAPSSSRATGAYRKDAFKYYYAEPEPREATCMVTGETMEASKIVAGHVYRQAWNHSVLVRPCLRLNMALRLRSAPL